jgi:hypothetical protein
MPYGTPTGKIALLKLSSLFADTYVGKRLMVKSVYPDS